MFVVIIVFAVREYYRCLISSGGQFYCCEMPDFYTILKIANVKESEISVRFNMGICLAYLGGALRCIH